MRYRVRSLLDEAVEILRRAQAEIDSEEGSGGPTIPAPIDPSSFESDQMVTYGENGYTDKYDPRLPDATRHSLKDGRVADIDLRVHVLPHTKYRCTKVHVLGEDEAQGKTIATVEVKSIDGTLVGDNVVLATNYQGNTDSFDDRIPGGNKVPIEHIITAPFSPPSLGPYAIYVAGPAGVQQMDSDLVGSLGLPGSRHVSFFLEFRERS